MKISLNLDPLIFFFCLVAIPYVISRIIKYLKNKQISSRLFLKARQKREERDKKLEDFTFPTSTLSPQIEEIILNASASDLLHMLNDDKVASEQILITYATRAWKFGLSLELIAETNFEKALHTARKCDEIRSQTPKQDRSKLGLLYGLPVSIKDCIEQEGFDSTCGLAYRCFDPIEKNGLVVDLLLKQGAIPFVRSNIPQCLLINESMCNIWGRACNPWDTTRTTGGSSGGEAGLIAARCSPFGIGTDIGGSVRIPALYCGIYALKPTCGRVTRKGCTILNPEKQSGNLAIQSTVGPMGKSVDDLRLLMKSWITKEAFRDDIGIYKVPWNIKWDKSNEELKKKLRIGFVVDDDFFGVSPANRRAVKEAADALKKRGHEIIELQLPNLKKVTLAYFALMSAEGKMRSFFAALKGEALMKEYATLKHFTMVPKFLRATIKMLLNLLNENRSADLLGVTGEKLAYEYMDYSKQMLAYREEVFNFFRQNNIDALLTPGLALPSVRHGTSRELMLNCCYTFYWNFLNFPTGAIPITEVKAGEDVYESKNHSGDMYHKKAKLCMENSEGLPVGIQVTTLPFKDEKCLFVMKEIEIIINFHKYAI